MYHNTYIAVRIAYDYCTLVVDVDGEAAPASGRETGG